MMQARKVDTRVLITGARGFVGPYVAEALFRICGSSVTLLPTAREAGEHPTLGQIKALDVTDRAAVEAAILNYAPTHVIHLAGIAAPAAANSNPQAAWRVNVDGALNLAQVISDKAPDCWLLNVGSGLIYGESANSGLPLNESALLAPIDEYSVTKAAADLALGARVRRGLKCIRMRPFNHTGVGQSDAFVVPAFAKQIARIEANLAPPIIQVGNLDAERDFLDVRDVASAYALAVQNTKSLEPGVILNIASGIPRRIRDVLEQLLALSRAKISIEVDKARYRPSDLPRIVGDARLARERLGWAPQHAIKETLTTVLNDCRVHVAKS